MYHRPLLLLDRMDWLVPLLRVGSLLVLLALLTGLVLGLRALWRTNFPKKPR